MAQSIVMNWNFSRASSVIESTLDTHTENGDLVPRYRVSNAKSLCSYDIPTHQFSEGQNGATMIHKVQNKNSSQIGHIRWARAMHTSLVFLRANAYYNGRGIGSGIPLHEFRRRVDGYPEAREFTVNGRSFFWIRANSELQDMICWSRKSDGEPPVCAAYYEEDGGVLTIHVPGQSQGDIIDEIPVSCVVNLHMRNQQQW